MGPIVVIIIFAVIVVGLFGLLALVIGGLILGFVPLWIQARASGVMVPLIQLPAMKLRGIDPQFVLDNAIELTKAGVDVELDHMEAHILAGGDLQRVVDATKSAEKAGLGVGFEKLCAIDLAGRDVERAVEASVNPVMISVPTIQALAQDGIRLEVRVRVTVRSNIHRQIGGAGDATIIARVGEGIVSVIGGAQRHTDILERPQLISQRILEKGLDSGTAYEIVSLDVSEVNVLDNVGARLREAQAEAEKLVAQARAETRRAMAVAREREMRAKVTEATGEVTANRANIPLALSGAVREGIIWRRGEPLSPVWGQNLWDANRRN